MARIPLSRIQQQPAEFESTTSIPGASQQGVVAAARGLQDIAGGIGAVGAGIDRFAIFQKEQQEKKVGFDNDVAYRELVQQAKSIPQEAALQAGVDGSGQEYATLESFTEKRKNIDARIAALRDEHPEAAARLEAQVNDLGNRLAANAKENEFRARNTWEVNELNDSTTEALEEVTFDPKQNDAIVAREQEKVKNAVTLTEQQAEMAMDEIEKKVRARELEMKQVQGPDAVRKALGGPMSANSQGVAIAKKFLRHAEGEVLTAYKDVFHDGEGGFRWAIAHGSSHYFNEQGQWVRVTPGTRITKEQADQLLNYRIATEFQPMTVKAVGADAYAALPSYTQGALISIAWNYGKIPQGVANAAKTGDPQLVAQAILGLKGQNQGVNDARRSKEARLAAGNADLDALSEYASTGSSGDLSFMAEGDPRYDGLGIDVRDKLLADSDRYWNNVINDGQKAQQAFKDEQAAQFSQSMLLNPNSVSLQDILGAGLDTDQENTLIKQWHAARESGAADRSAAHSFRTDTPADTSTKAGRDAVAKVLDNYVGVDDPAWGNGNYSQKAITMEHWPQDRTAHALTQFHGGNARNALNALNELSNVYREKPWLLSGENAKEGKELAARYLSNLNRNVSPEEAVNSMMEVSNVEVFESRARTYDGEGGKEIRDEWTGVDGLVRAGVPRPTTPHEQASLDFYAETWDSMFRHNYIRMPGQPAEEIARYTFENDFSQMVGPSEIEGYDDNVSLLDAATGEGFLAWWRGDARGNAMIALPPEKQANVNPNHIPAMRASVDEFVETRVRAAGLDPDMVQGWILVPNEHTRAAIARGDTTDIPYGVMYEMDNVLHMMPGDEMVNIFRSDAGKQEYEFMLNEMAEVAETARQEEAVSATTEGFRVLDEVMPQSGTITLPFEETEDRSAEEILRDRQEAGREAQPSGDRSGITTSLEPTPEDTAGASVRRRSRRNRVKRGNEQRRQDRINFFNEMRNSTERSPMVDDRLLNLLEQQIENDEISYSEARRGIEMLNRQFQREQAERRAREELGRTE